VGRGELEQAEEKDDGGDAHQQGHAPPSSAIILYQLRIRPDPKFFNIQDPDRIRNDLSSRIRIQIRIRNDLTSQIWIRNYPQGPGLLKSKCYENDSILELI